MDPRVQTVIAIIEKDLCRQRPLIALAKSVSLSPSRLRHLFKADTGMTPAQYLKFLRLEKAKYLLETTFLSAKVIMSRIGMANINHFTEDFKRIYGLPPAKYRAHFLRTNTPSPVGSQIR